MQEKQGKKDEVPKLGMKEFPAPPEAQQGNLQQERDEPAQGATAGPNWDNATSANEAMRDNVSLRSALENLLKINKIEMQPHFIQQLDEITKAGLPGKDLLLDMIQTASTRSDPAPEGDSNRPLTQADVIVLAKRLAEAKAAAQNAEEDLAANNDDIEDC